LVVKAQPSEELPDSLNGIQVRTVRRQELKAEVWLALLSPFAVQQSVVILCVVDDHYDAPA
jgi:hypothetical protein